MVLTAFIEIPIHQAASLCIIVHCWTECATTGRNLTYIDYERMARDMEMGGDVFTIETAHDEVHVFWNH